MWLHTFHFSFFLTKQRGPDNLIQKSRGSQAKRRGGGPGPSGPPPHATGLPRPRWGAYSAPPDPLAVIGEGEGRGREGRGGGGGRGGKGGEGKIGILPPPTSTSWLRHCSLHSFYALQSSSSLSICVPLRNTSRTTYGSFPSVEPKIWNALPCHISSIRTLPAFRRGLKHHFSCLLILVVGHLVSTRHDRFTLRDTTPPVAIAPLKNTMPSS